MRYRKIECEHCGFMQLKRDRTCDRCGELTARERTKFRAYLAYLAVSAIAVGMFVVRMGQVAPGP